MSNDVIEKFRPCGLLREKCFTYTDGPIKLIQEQ